MTEHDSLSGTPPSDHQASSADAPNADSGTLDGIPFFQRLYDRPFVLLALGLAVMLVVFTAWGLWEVMTLPQATLP